ncbi:hypothetical protein [Meridianimarinicoccus sp. MJW13]|uniref:hypothetical protein n=1 Tax=Meridianimarinicoccus sp. MJW13 TaxID=2720031 RepID=UPI0018670A05|nr:hypothetical protein [Fluviibacterium sp. MJW13]
MLSETQKNVIIWVVGTIFVLATAGLATIWVLFAYWSITLNFDVVFENFFVALIGLPLAAGASTALVVLFSEFVGQIELDILALKFKGASGPIIMWCLSYLTIVVGIAALT